MTGRIPELCYIVTKLSQKMSKPSQADLNTAKHVLRYLSEFGSYVGTCTTGEITKRFSMFSYSNNLPSSLSDDSEILEYLSTSLTWLENHFPGCGVILAADCNRLDIKFA